MALGPALHRRPDFAPGGDDFGRRPIEHVRHERDRPDRAALDRCVLGLACVGEMADEMWSALLASVALRDRYLLPGV